MRPHRLLLFSFSFIILFASAAAAQVQRTFVSGSGSDGNPCSRTAPCRTFTQAISQTSAGGEVIVLDSAGYGAFTITQAVTVQAAPGAYAGISVFSGDGVDINAGGTDTVILRGLTINNQGSTGGGIVFNSGGTLRVEACVVQGFSLSGSSQGIGYSAGNLLIRDTAIGDCSIGIQSNPSSGTVRAAIEHVTLSGCSIGVAIDVNSGTSSFATIRDSSISGSSSVGMRTLANGFGTVAILNVERCSVTNGAGGGVATQSPVQAPSVITISNCLISGNRGPGYCVSSGSVILSLGNNTFYNNVANCGSLSQWPAQ